MTTGAVTVVVVTTRRKQVRIVMTDAGFRTTLKAALSVSALLASSVFLPTNANAQEASDAWQFRASLYGYFPDIEGAARFPGADDINIDAEDLIDRTDNVFMGAFEAQRGRFGAFADVIYLNLGNSVQDTTQVSIGGGTPLPPGVTMDGALNIDAWVWTVAGSYRVVQSSNATVDLFGGARLLNADADLDYAFNVDFGPFSGPAREGSLSVQGDNWDAIVGVRGRNTFGAEGGWFVTYYADVGAGDSDLTWQAIVGGGRSFGRYDITAGWRHLEYEFGDDARIDSFVFDGPMVGASANF
jgi:hypothetical protein